MPTATKTIVPVVWMGEDENLYAEGHHDPAAFLLGLIVAMEEWHGPDRLGRELRDLLGVEGPLTAEQIEKPMTWVQHYWLRPIEVEGEPDAGEACDADVVGAVPMTRLCP